MSCSVEWVSLAKAIHSRAKEDVLRKENIFANAKTKFVNHIFTVDYFCIFNVYVNQHE